MSCSNCASRGGCYFAATKGDLPDPLSSGLCDCSIGIVQGPTGAPEIFILGPDSRLNPFTNPLQRTWLPISANSYDTVLLFGGEMSFNGGGPSTFFLSDDASVVTPGADVTARAFPVMPPSPMLAVPTLHRLSVNSLVNTLANNATVEVFQGGVGTGMSVVVLAGTTTIYNAIGEIALSGTLQDLDLRVSSPGAEGALILSAAIEITIPKA